MRGHSLGGRRGLIGGGGDATWGISVSIKLIKRLALMGLTFVMGSFTPSNMCQFYDRYTVSLLNVFVKIVQFMLIVNVWHFFCSALPVI